MRANAPPKAQIIKDDPTDPVSDKTPPGVIKIPEPKITPEIRDIAETKLTSFFILNSDEFGVMFMY